MKEREESSPINRSEDVTDQFISNEQTNHTSDCIVQLT